MRSIDSRELCGAALLVLACLALSCDASQGATRPDRAAPATAGAAPEAQASAAAGATACAAPELLAMLPGELPEASGIAPATRSGQSWVHNDSERRPTLYRVDERGRITQRVRLRGARLEDWEDIAQARCATGNCLYLADIGDNLHTRPAVRVLRVREPAARDSIAARFDAFAFRYPDGPADAEAIFVLPGERLYVITKGRNRAATLYRYPGRLRPDTVTLERLRTLTAGVAQFPDMVTGASAARDGHHVAIRRYGYVELFRVRNGDLLPAGRLELGPIGERQGEGVALQPDGALLLVGERGPGGTAGTLGRVRCMLH